VSHSRRAGNAPVVFDEDAFDHDIRRSSAHGMEVAAATRALYERDGAPTDQLRKCEAEGGDGTRLPDCLKVYLPTPAGPFGMVFQLVARQGNLQLRYAAFGVRHHPPESNALTVYQIADRRLAD
jgi:hypothetical protein